MAGNVAGFDPAGAYEVNVFDVVYRRTDEGDLQARIYQPQGEGPFRALIHVHGGQWRRGSREGDALVNQALAAGGLVVVAMDFRLAPTHPYPAQVADVNYAIRWFKHHAAAFNTDPRRLGGFGTSSGGHTLMLSALRPTFAGYSELRLDEAPEAEASFAYIMLAWPVLDPLARLQFAQETGREDLITATQVYFAGEGSLEEGNPQQVLERHEAETLPPVLIVHGTADENVPLAVSERFAEAYREVGGSARVEVFPGMPHAFAQRPGLETDRAIALLKRFIAEQVGA